MPGAFSIELRGFDEAEGLLLRLSDFQKLARIPLSAAMGSAKTVMQDEVGSRKAKDSIKVRVAKEGSGLVGKVGPTGNAGRPGFLAALFLETGTGEEGPKKHLIRPAQGRAMAFFSQGLITERFGGQLTTSHGRIRTSAIRAYGNAGQMVIRSDRGMKARPWFDRANSRARPLIGQRFAEKFHDQIEALRRG